MNVLNLPRGGFNERPRTQQQQQLVVAFLPASPSATLLLEVVVVGVVAIEISSGNTFCAGIAYVSVNHG